MQLVDILIMSYELMGNKLYEFWTFFTISCIFSTSSSDKSFISEILYK